MLMLIMLSVVCQDFSGIDWDAAVVHFEVSDITPESRKDLKAGLEELHREVRGFRADAAIGKDGVIVTSDKLDTNLQKYDVIKAVNGTAIKNTKDLQAAVAALEPGLFAKFDILRPTIKGNRAPFVKMQVDYAPTSEYLLALAPFEIQEVKATRQTLYIPRNAETRKAMYLQLMAGPKDEMKTIVVFNLVVSLYTSNTGLSSATLITPSKTIRTRIQTHEMSNYSAIPGEKFRYWMERDANRQDMAGVMEAIKGNDNLTLQLSSSTFIEVEIDITQSIRENLMAIEKLKAALASRKE